MDKEFLQYVETQAQRNIQFMNVIEDVTEKLAELTTTLTGLERAEEDVSELKRILTDDSQGLRFLIRSLTEVCNGLEVCIDNLKKCTDIGFKGLNDKIDANNRDNETNYKDLLITFVKAVGVFLSGIGTALLVYYGSKVG